jgi:hypothetical protein
MARAFLRRAATAVCGLACLLAASAPGHAQTFTQRGFIEASATWFAQDAPNDDAHTVVDHLVRQEVFVAPVPWLRAVAGADVRANTHEQVDARARLDVDDRGVKRPLFGVRRFSAAATHGPFTLEAGRQFIRWGKTDIVTPTDHFAPRDFINVVSSEFLAVTGVRAMASSRADTFDVVWVPWFTPSRMPLTDQRWTVLPPAAAGLTLRSLAPVMPERGPCRQNCSSCGGIRACVPTGPTSPRRTAGSP